VTVINRFSSTRCSHLYTNWRK